MILRKVMIEGRIAQVGESGSQATLPPPSPLRTVLATFTAHGSSLDKPLRQSRPFGLRDTNVQPSYLSVYLGACQFTLQPVAAPIAEAIVICFAAVVRVLQTFSRSKTNWKSAPFRVRRCFSPYPRRYNPAFAFSSFLYPPPQQILLRFTCPQLGGKTGLPRSP